MTARDQFNRQASHYDQQWADWNQASLQWMIDRVAAWCPQRLLDVATGTGYTARGLAPFANQVVGVDVAEGMLARAREQGIPNARFEMGAAESLGFPDESFELVSCRIAPHHFASVPAFLAESRRVLVPGGRLLIGDTTVPAEIAEWQNQVERLRDPSHVRNYSPEEWRALLEAAGFRIDEMEVPVPANSVSLVDWLAKAGCSGAAAEEVRAMFGSAPAAARRAFQIAPAGEDFRFAWLRVMIAATRP